MLDYIIKDTGLNPKHCVIWMHGLGADAQNMAQIATTLDVNKPIRHIFINAPLRPVTLNQGFVMRAWFDIYGLQASEKIDIPGMQASQAAIEEIISLQHKEGFYADNIFLAGFSQGAAMALWIALMHKEAFAGILALSGFLPLAIEHKVNDVKSLRLFFAIGLQDEVIYPEWTLQSAKYFESLGCKDLVLKKYDMAHAVCDAEIIDISSWLLTKIDE